MRNIRCVPVCAIRAGVCVCVSECELINIKGFVGPIYDRVDPGTLLHPFLEKEREGKREEIFLYFIFLDDDADAAVETERRKGERTLKDPRRDSLSLSFELLDRTKQKRWMKARTVPSSSSSSGSSSQCKTRGKWEEKKSVSRSRRKKCPNLRK